MEKQKVFAAIECMLFVAGDPIPILELQRALDMTDIELRPVLADMQDLYRREERGILLSLTDQTAQLISNRSYAQYVEALLQPAQQKSFSQSLIETLAIVAYRQPVTRADIEAVRGVRCEYAVAQLQKMNMIQPIGRKEVVGRPMLFATTDAFLRHFSIQSVMELPNYEAYSKEEDSPEGILTV